MGAPKGASAMTVEKSPSASADRAPQARLHAALPHAGPARPHEAGHPRHPRDRGREFPSQKALDIFAAHGCGSTPSARSSRSRPTSCSRPWRRAPRYFDLGARDPACAFSLSRRHHLLHERRLRRRDRRLRDRASSGPRPRPTWRASRACSDYLSSISFWWPTISAGDCGETAQLHELDAGWNNTVKHLQGMVNGAREARYARRDGDGRSPAAPRSCAGGPCSPT